MGETNIEWTDFSWNPVRGCTKISPGCKHCYAETFAERWRGVKGHPYEFGFDLRLVPSKLSEPLKIKKPSRIFVNSMSDLFQQDVPFDYVDECFRIMGACDDAGLNHEFQVLTKRADLMQEYMRSEARSAWNGPRMNRGAFPPLNVWLGVSVEDREYGKPRIDLLRETPAAVRFLSIEPLLEDLGRLNLDGIHWVILGSESGPKARGYDTMWFERIIRQCEEQGVACFVKQLTDHRGRKIPYEQWLGYLQVRQFPEARHV